MPKIPIALESDGEFEKKHTHTEVQFHLVYPSCLCRFVVESSTYLEVYDWSKTMQYDDTANFVKVEDSLSDALIHLGNRKRP